MFFEPPSMEYNESTTEKPAKEQESQMMFPPVKNSVSPALIKVIGVGGGGGNAVAHMCMLSGKENIRGVEFYDVNTDEQVLSTRSGCQTIQIGKNTTGGLGAGADPEVGRISAEEDRDALEKMLDGANMVFLAVGMGGGTGTGAAPVIAEIAKEKKILTVAVVTKPFIFEGNRRMRLAMEGINKLKQSVDSLIIIPNDKLRGLGKQVSLQEGFKTANGVLSNCVLGITNMITSSGGSSGNDINVDFADVRTVMSNKGLAMIGAGYAEGEGRAEKAMHQALTSPLLENVDISGASGLLVSLSVGPDFLIDEVYTMMELVNGYAEDAVNVFGVNYYEEMKGKVGITLVATGIGKQEELPRVPPFGARPQQANTAAETHRAPYQENPYQPTAPNNQPQGYPTNNNPTGYGNESYQTQQQPQVQLPPEQPQQAQTQLPNRENLYVPSFMQYRNPSNK